MIILLRLESDGIPQSWPMLKKVYCTYIPTIVGFLVCFALTTTVPAEAQFVSEFHVSSRVALFPFSFFTLGLAFGPLLAAPISENYGRRPVYLLGLLAFSLFTLGLVEINLADGVSGSGSGMTYVFSVLRMIGMIWPADNGSYTSLFCVASQDMKAEQSSGHLEIFKRFGEPTWQSGPAKDAKLGEKLEEYTREVMRREGRVQ